MPNDKTAKPTIEQAKPDYSYINPITKKPYWEDKLIGQTAYTYGKLYMPEEQERLLGSSTLMVSPEGLEKKMALAQPGFSIFNLGESKVWRIGKSFAVNFVAGVLYSVGAYDPELSLQVIEDSDIEWNKLYQTAYKLQQQTQTDPSFAVHSVYDESVNKWNSAAFWKKSADTQGLSAGAMALAVATSIAIESLTAGLGTEAAAANIAKTLKATADVQKIAKAIKLAQSAVKTMAMARAINRHSESVLEAWDSYSSTYEKMLFLGYSQDVAKDYASKAASMTYKMQLPLLALDLLSVFTLVPTASGMTGLTEHLLEKGIKSSVARGLVALGLEMGNESLEEGYQQYVQGTVMNDVLHSASMDYFGFYDTWGKDMWDAMLQGAMGVPFTTFFMRGVPKILGARRAIRARKYYNEAINSLAENRLSIIKQINDELAKGEKADLNKVNQLKDVLNIYNTIHSLYLDGVSKKDKALEGYKTFLKGIINNIDKGNYEAIKEFNVNENNAKAVREHTQGMLSDVEFMENIYKQLVSNKVPHEIAMNATKFAMLAEKAKNRVSELNLKIAQNRQNIVSELTSIKNIKESLTEEGINDLADILSIRYKKEINNEYIRGLFKDELSKEQIKKIADKLKKYKEQIDTNRLTVIANKLGIDTTNKDLESILNDITKKLGNNTVSMLISDSLMRESLKETEEFAKQSTEKFADWINPKNIEKYKKEIEEANKKKIEETKKRNKEAKKRIEKEKGAKPKVETEDTGDFDLSEADDKHTDGTIEEVLEEEFNKQQQQQQEQKQQPKKSKIEHEIDNLKQQLSQVQTEEEKAAIQAKLEQKQKEFEEFKKKKEEEERKKRKLEIKTQRVRNAVRNLVNIIEVIDEDIIKRTIAEKLEEQKLPEGEKKTSKETKSSLISRFVDIDDEELADPMTIAEKINDINTLPEEYIELIVSAIEELVEAVKDLTGREPTFEMLVSHIQEHTKEDEFNKTYTALAYGWMEIKRALPRDLVRIYREYANKIKEVKEKEIKKKEEIKANRDKLLVEYENAAKELGINTENFKNKVLNTEVSTKVYDLIYEEVKKQILNLKKQNKWTDKEFSKFANIISLLESLGYDMQFAKEISKSEQQQSMQQQLMQKQQTETTQQQKIEETEKPNFSSFEEVTLHSGGAIGADTAWSDIAKSYGVKNHNHYYIKGFKTPNGNKPIKLTEQEKQRLDNILTNINKRYLNRQYPPKDEYAANLLRRNIYQVENSDKVLAISTIVNGQVQGGTAWAVYYAISLGKPVYVFDQNTGDWYKYNYETNQFEISIIPVLSKNTATIGTRKLNDIGRKAIKDVFDKTKLLLEEKQKQKKNVNETLITPEHFIIYDSTAPRLSIWKVEDIYAGQINKGSVTTENGINYLPTLSTKNVITGDKFKVIIPENVDMFLGLYYYEEDGKIEEYRGTYGEFKKAHPEFAEANLPLVIVDGKGKQIASITSHLIGYMEWAITEDNRSDFIANMKREREKLIKQIKEKGYGTIKITGKGGTYVKVLKEGELTLKDTGYYSTPAVIYTNSNGNRYLAFKNNLRKLDTDVLISDDFAIVLQSGITDNCYVELRLAYYTIHNNKKIPVFYAYRTRVKSLQEYEVDNIVNAIKLFVDSIRFKTANVRETINEIEKVFKGFNKINSQNFGIGNYLNSIIRGTQFYDLNAKSNQGKTVEDIKQFAYNEIENAQQEVGGMLTVKFIIERDKYGKKRTKILISVGIKKDEFSSVEINQFIIDVAKRDVYEDIAEVEKFIRENKDYISAFPYYRSLSTVNDFFNIILEEDQNGVRSYRVEKIDYREYLREKYLTRIYPIKLVDKNGKTEYALLASPNISFEAIDEDDSNLTVVEDFVALDEQEGFELYENETKDIDNLSEDTAVTDTDQTVAVTQKAIEEDEKEYQEEKDKATREQQAKIDAQRLGLTEDFGIDINLMSEPVQVTPEDIQRIKEQEEFKAGIPTKVFKQIKNYFTGKIFEIIQQPEKLSKKAVLDKIHREIVDKLDNTIHNLQNYIELHQDLDSAEIYVQKAKILAEIVEKLRNNSKELASELYLSVEDMLAEKKIEEVNGDIVDNGDIGTDENMEDTNRNVFKSVLEINPKESLSYKIRRLFATIVDTDHTGKIKLGIGGLPQYIDFDTAYDIVKSILIIDRQPEPTLEWMINELSKHIDKYPWIEQLIEKLKNADSKTQNAFVVNMTNSYHKPVTVLVRKDDTGEVSVYINEESKSNITEVWKQEFIRNYKTGNKLIVTKGDKFKVNKELLETVKKKLNIALGGDLITLNKNFETAKAILNKILSSKNTDTLFFREEELPKGFVDKLKREGTVTINLNVKGGYNGVNITHYAGYYRADYKTEIDIKTGEKQTYIRLIRNNKREIIGSDIIEILDLIGLDSLSELSKKAIIKHISKEKYSFIKQWLDYLNEIKGKEVEDIAMPLEFNTALFNEIAKVEVRENKVSPKLSVSINGKNIYLAQPTKLITDELNKVKYDKEKTKQLRLISYSKHSFILDLLDNVDSTRDVLDYNEVSPSVIERTDVKDRENKELFELSEAEIELTKLALFQYRSQLDKVKFKDFDVVESRIALQTISDKERMPILKTYVLDLRDDNINIKSITADRNRVEVDIELDDKLGRLLFEYLVKPEIERIQYRLQGKGEEYDGFSDGAYYFYNIKQLNYTKLKDGKTALEKIKDGETLFYEDVKDVINKHFSDKITSYINQLIEYNIIKVEKIHTKEGNDEYRLSQTFMDNRYLTKFSTENAEELITYTVADYVINSSLIIAESYKLLAGDTAIYWKAPKNIKQVLKEKEFYQLTKEEYEQIYKGLLDNAVKRFAMLLAPGTGMVKGKYEQVLYVFAEDIKEPAVNYEHLVEIFYGKPSEEDKKQIELARKGDTEALKYLENKFPEIKDYLYVTKTDAQEYVTVREYLNTMLLHGEIDLAGYNKLLEKYEKQLKWKDKNPDKPFPPELRFSKEELELFDKKTFQHLKPVYTNKIDDDFNNMLYVKTSTFVLLPENTFGWLRTLRRAMEKLEKEQGNVGVRLAFASSTKLGAKKKKLKIIEGGIIRNITVSDLKEASMLVPRDGLRIQQEAPYKAYKKEENTIRLVTQMWKTLLGDDNADRVKFKLNGKVYTGRELIDLYNQVFFDLFDVLTDLLLNEIGVVTKDGEYLYDFNSFKTGLINLLKKEAKKRGFSKKDIETLEAYTSKDKNGQFIVDFIIPLWLHQNSNKLQSLLLSLFKNNVLKPNMPGYGYVVTSGVLWQEYKVRKESEMSSGTAIVYTKYWNGEKLIADKNIVQVFLPHRFKDKNGNLIDLFEVDPKTKQYKYIEIKNNNYYLKEGAIDDDLLHYVGARIPFSGLVSGTVYQVAGFITDRNGDSMVVADSVIVKKGLDHDFDKEWLYIPHYKLEGNKIKKVGTEELEQVKEKVRNMKEKLVEAQEIKKKNEQLLASVGSDPVIEKAIKKNEQTINKIVKLHREYSEELRKILDNIIIDIHLAVFMSEDNELRKKINQPLTIDFERKQANLIEQLREGRTETSDDLTNSNTFSKRTYRMSNGKMAIGAYSQNLTLHSLITMLEEKPDLALTEYFNYEKGEYEVVPFKLTFRNANGDITSNGELGRIKTLDGGRRISDVFNAIQNTATDDAKENILGRVNINRETIGVHNLLVLLGFDKAKVTNSFGEETEISIPYFFLSQPIIVDFVASFENRTGIIENERFKIEKRALEAIADKYGLTEEDINEIVKIIRKDIKSLPVIDTQKLYNEISNPSKEFQKDIIKVFIMLRNIVNEFRKANFTVNSNNNFKNSIFELLDLVNSYEIVYAQSKYIRWKSKFADIVYDKSKFDSRTFDFSKFGFNFGIRPNNFVTYQIVKTLHSALSTFGQFFLVEDKHFMKAVKIIAQNSRGTEIEVAKEAEIAYKYFVYSSIPVTKDIAYERARLLLDNKNAKLSLGTYLLKLRITKNPHILGNAFINKLSISFPEEIGQETAIKFEAALGYYDEDYLRSEFVSLLDNLNRLPDFNYNFSEYSDISDKENVKTLVGLLNKPFTEQDIEDKTLLPEKGFKFRIDVVSYKIVKLGKMTYEELKKYNPEAKEFSGKKEVYRVEYFYTPKDLALDLAIYALITKHNYAYSFVRLVPIEIMKALGITDHLRMFDYRKDNDAFIVSKLGFNKGQPHLSRFVVQFFQHNPYRAHTIYDNIDRFLSENRKNLSETGNGVNVIYDAKNDILYFVNYKKQEEGMPTYTQVKPVKWKYAVAYDTNSKRIATSDRVSMQLVYKPEQLSKVSNNNFKANEENQRVEEFVSKVKAEKDILKLLDIFEVNTKSEYNKALIQIVRIHLEQKLKYLDKSKVVFDSNLVSNGAYNIAKNTIAVNIDRLKSEGIEKIINVVLHETLHYLTSVEIRQYIKREENGKYSYSNNTPREVKDLVDIFNYAINIARKEVKGFDEKLTQFRLGNVTLLKAEDRIAYHLSSLEEFITGVLTNKEIREWLNKKQYEGKSVLQRVLYKIKQFLQWLFREVKKGSLLQESIARVMNYIEFETKQYKPDLRLGSISVVVNENIETNNDLYIYSTSTNTIYTNNKQIERIATSKRYFSNEKTTYKDGSYTIPGDSLLNMDSKVRRYFAKAMLANVEVYSKFRSNFANIAQFQAFLARKSYIDTLLILHAKSSLISHNTSLAENLNDYEKVVREKLGIKEKFDILRTETVKSEGVKKEQPIKVTFDKLEISFVVGSDTIGLKELADRINKAFGIDININLSPVVKIENSIEEVAKVTLTSDKQLAQQDSKYVYVEETDKGINLWHTYKEQTKLISAIDLLRQKTIGIKDISINAVEKLLDKLSIEVEDDIMNNTVEEDISNYDLAKSKVNKDLTVVANDFSLDSITITKDNIKGFYKLIGGNYKGKYVVELKDYSIVVFDSVAKKEKQTSEDTHTVQTVSSNSGQIVLTKTQQAAKNFLVYSKDRYLVLEGKAGTGKTTVLIKAIEDFTKQWKSVMVLAPTHAALNVLKRKIKESGITGVQFSTIASFLGKTKDYIEDTFISQMDKKVIADVLIIDEASMISEDEFTDIDKTALDKGINKIIFSGDIGQLRPVKMQSKSPIFRLPNKFKLTERIRQGEGNPILEYADPFWNNNQSDDPVRDPSSKQVTTINDKGALIFTNNQSQFITEAYNEFVYGLKENNPYKTKIVAFRNNTVKYYNDRINKMLREKIFSKLQNVKTTPDNKYIVGSANGKTFGSFITLYSNYKPATIPQEILDNIQTKLHFDLDILEFDLNNSETYMVKDIIDTSLRYKSIDPVKAMKLLEKMLLENSGWFDIKEFEHQLNKQEFKVEYNINVVFVNIEIDEGNSKKKYLYPIAYIQDSDRKLLEDKMYNARKMYRDIEKKYINSIYKSKAIRRVVMNIFSTIDSFAHIEQGYAVTSHKSQGSTYDSVFVDKSDILSVNPKGENINRKELNKQLSESVYTALTRSRYAAVIYDHKHNEQYKGEAVFKLIDKYKKKTAKQKLPHKPSAIANIKTLSEINISISASSNGDTLTYRMLSELNNTSTLYKYNKELTIDEFKRVLGTDDTPSVPSLNLVAILSALNTISRINGEFSTTIYTNYIGVTKWLNGEWKAKKDYVQVLVDQIRNKIEELKQTGKEVSIVFSNVKEQSKFNNRFDKATKTFDNLINELNSSLPDENTLSEPVTVKDIDNIKLRYNSLRYESDTDIIAIEEVSDIIDADDDLKKELLEIEKQISAIQVEHLPLEENLIKC